MMKVCKKKKPERMPVAELYVSSIDVIPIHVDGWADILESYGGSGAGVYWEAEECQGCGTVVVFTNGSFEETHSDIDPKSKCAGSFGYSEGPMMNYWYPVEFLRQSPEEAAIQIADLPLCLLQIGDVYGLALTGGGMNLSWQICEAYTRLGHLPPIHFCQLPAMADRLRPADSVYGREVYGRESLLRDLYIVAACRKAVRVRMARDRVTLGNLNHLTEGRG